MSKNRKRIQSTYKKTIKEIEKNLASLPDYEAGSNGREQQKQTLLLFATEQIKKLNWSRDQLIEECAKLTVTAWLEEDKFEEYIRREELLIRPALVAAATMADSLSKTQSEKAQLARGKKLETIDGDFITIDSIIKKLANNREYLDETAEELWGKFHGILDKKGLNPKVIRVC